MYKVKLDIARNRLYVTLVGFFSIEEIKRCGDETIAATKKLRRGYDVVTDISGLKPGTPEVAEVHERVQAHFRASGARQGVRVIGGAFTAASLQLNRTAKLVGFQSTTVATLADAEKLLDAL
jgi:hypothetical protein